MPLAFPDIKDVGVVARFERWGYPWHGLATAGSLDTSTHPIVQPSGGDTYLQRFPGVPALNLPPAQVAADALVGMQWLDYLIVSGKNQQIYGSIDLGPLGWIYGSSDGSRWWIKITSGATVSGNSATFAFSVVRFGEFNGTPETYTRTVALSDLGQATPTVTFSSGSESGTSGYSCTATTLQVDLDDVQQDGSQAVIALRSNCPAGLLSWTPSWWAGERVPLGFLLVSIADGASGPTVSVSVLHSRAATLGSANTTNGYHVADRILGVWFDSAGTAMPVKLSMDFPLNLDQTYWSDPGGYPYSESLSASSTGNWTWRLDWGAKTATWSAAVSASQSATRSKASVSDPLVCSYSGNVSYSVGSLLAGTYNYTSSGCAISVAASCNIGYFEWDSSGTQYASVQQAYPGAGIIKPDMLGFSGARTGSLFAWCVKRLSNKYFALLAMKFPVGSDIQPADPFAAWSQTNDMVLIGGFCPAGNDVSNAGALGIQPNVVPTVTVNPESNSPFLKPNGQAVCYV